MGSGVGKRTAAVMRVGRRRVVWGVLESAFDSHTAPMLKHSYSAIKDFQGCARRYHQVRILRRFKSEPTEATQYGERLHKAFELYLTQAEPLPADLVRHQPMLDTLVGAARTIICEQKMGVRADFTPCDFFADDVWMRGVPDLLMLDCENGKAWLGDWKSGKSARFADTEQLELMAAMTMAHYPEIDHVRGILAFVVAGTAVKAEYRREQLPAIWSKWVGRADMIRQALDNDVWNATPSALCRFCPVNREACEHR